MKSIITKIESQKKTKDRVNVYINEAFAFACSSELIYYHGLTKGMEINPIEFEEVIKSDSYIRGKNVALKYLEKSMKTEKQIEDMLLKKEFHIDTIHKIIEFLKNYGFLDDKKYAQNFINQKIGCNGTNKIKQDLSKKGIEKELIKELLMNVEPETEYNIALSLAQKKFSVLSKSEKDKNKLFQKITYHLLSKGYNYSIINEVIPKLWINFQEEEEVDSKDMDLDELLTLTKKRYTLLKSTESNELKLKKKLQDFLLRKGYTYDAIKTVIIQVMNEDDDL